MSVIERQKLWLRFLLWRTRKMSHRTYILILSAVVGVLSGFAAVVLGNLQDTSAIPALEKVIQTEPEPLVRGHAAWALGQMHSPRARTVLEKQLAHEMDETVAQEIRSAVATC